MAGVYDMTVRAGATFRLRLGVQRDGAPVDLTGWQARWQVRPDKANSTILLDATSVSGDGRVVFDVPTEGGIMLTLTADQTAELAWTYGVYGLSLIDSGGEVQLLLEGNVTVIPAVPR